MMPSRRAVVALAMIAGLLVTALNASRQALGSPTNGAIAASAWAAKPATRTKPPVTRVVTPAPPNAKLIALERGAQQKRSDGVAPDTFGASTDQPTELGGSKPLAGIASAANTAPKVHAPTSEADAEEAARRLRFDKFYNGEGNAPWDIQKPQAAVVQFESAGAFRGQVLDVGCGSGDNAIFLASKGYNVTGVDFIGTAIKLGRARSAALVKEGRQLTLQFHVGSAFDLAVVLGAGAKYDTVLDSGFFHTLHTDRLRDEYATSLAAVVHSGSRLVLLAMRAGEEAEEDGQTENGTILGFRVNVGESTLTQQLAKAGWRVDSIVAKKFVNEKRAEHDIVVTWARPMWAVTATKL